MRTLLSRLTRTPAEDRAQLQAQLADAQDKLRIAVNHHLTKADEMARERDRAIVELHRTRQQLDIARQERDEALGLHDAARDAGALRPPIGSTDYWRRRALAAEANCHTYENRLAAAENRPTTGAVPDLFYTPLAAP